MTVSPSSHFGLVFHRNFFLIFWNEDQNQHFETSFTFLKNHSAFSIFYPDFVQRKFEAFCFVLGSDSNLRFF